MEYTKTFKNEAFNCEKYSLSFPCIILTCSNYMHGKEFCEIFNVTFERQGGKDKQLSFSE